MNEDLITVIIPVYKVEEYLEKCVKSICNQTYENLEIILVDDGSPDNCGKMCDKYAEADKRIKVIHKENSGLSDARNAGLKIATGKYIAFIDSDDYVSNDYIQYMYQMIKKENTKIAICGVQVVWKNKDFEKYENENIQNFEKLTSNKALENLLYAEGIEISAYGKLYDKDLWKDIQFPKGKVYEDTKIMYKLFEKAETIVFGRKKCYYYVARIGSISKNKGYNKNEEDYIKHTNEMLEYIEKKYPELESAVKRFDVYAKFRILRMLIYTKPRNRKMEKEIIAGIEKYQKDVMQDSRVPKRDKLAIISLKCGLPVFKLMWTLYCKVTGRI